MQKNIAQRRGDAEDVKVHENEPGTIIIDEAIKIHRKLRPGLLGYVHEAVLAYRLNKRDLKQKDK